MGKLKTKKGVAKRFKLTKKKKIVFYPGGKGHLAANKEAKKIRKMKRASGLKGRKERAFLRSMLPYGSK